jgi:hypothetical protein
MSASSSTAMFGATTFDVTPDWAPSSAKVFPKPISAAFVAA